MPKRHADPPEECEQENGERHQADQRIAQNLERGQEGINRIDTPAMEPSSAARGTTRRVQSPTKASAVLARPIAMVMAIPTFHASSASPVASITGPSTPNTMANSVGVSIPKGMAVTSVRPVRRISRTASTV